MLVRTRWKAALVVGICSVVAGGLLLPFGPSQARRAVDATPVEQPALMENLGRALVAMRRPQNNAEVYVGWRLLGTDPSGVAFNLYRSTGGGEAVKLNSDPITATTDFVDTGADLG